MRTVSMGSVGKAMGLVPFLPLLLGLGGCGGGSDTPPAPTHTLTFGVSPAGAGTLSRPIEGPFSQGRAVTLLAVPLQPGYVLSEWQVPGSAPTTGNPLALVMDADKTVTAVFHLVHGSWTWVGGTEYSDTNSPTAAGIYGKKGEASPLNAPGVRRRSSGLADAEGVLWLFGGYGWGFSIGDGHLSDVWKFDTASLQWTWAAGGNDINLPPAVGTPGVAATINSPGGRISVSGWADTNSRRMWLFGGNDGGQDLNDLWWFDPALKGWAQAQPGSVNGYAIFGTRGMANPANRPGARSGGAAGRSADGALWLFGGYGWGYSTVGVAEEQGFLGDLWKFTPDPATPPGRWTWVKGNPSASAPALTVSPVWPGGVSRSAFCTDPAGNLWVFGGRTAAGISADLWKFAPATSTWSVYGPLPRGQLDIAPVRGALKAEDPSYTPGSRYGASLWADPAGMIWLFGGDNGANQFADLWRFDPIGSGNWSMMAGTSALDAPASRGTRMVASTAHHPSGRRVEGASWVDKDGRFWLFGGWGLGDDYNMGILADLWVYQP